MAPYIAPQRLYLTRDRSRVVFHDDPEAATLLAAEGSVVAEDEVKRLGLREELRAVESVPDPVTTAPPPPAQEPEKEPVHEPEPEMKAARVVTPTSSMPVTDTVPTRRATTSGDGGSRGGHASSAARKGK